MKAEVKDKITEGSAFCYLVSVRLSEYIGNLPDDYMNYDVQREIVNNSYLDNLIQTIIDKRHVPLMVLVAEDENLRPENDIIKVGSFKVLDGLQRTYRLKVIGDTISLAIEALATDPGIGDLNRLALSKQFKAKLGAINSSVLILEKLLFFAKKQTDLGINALRKLYDRPQWFELWVGLTPPDEVNKMLILNAGHKAVKNQHQLELLFSNVLPLFKKTRFENFEVKREKEISSISYSKNRIPGQFHFSHLITAILSFDSGKPITNNVNLIQKAQTEDFDDSIFDKLINYEFIDYFISTLMALDKKLTARYNDVAVKWLGRETSLTGLFAACGKYAQEHGGHAAEALNTLETKIGDQPDVLRLNEFEDVRNSLDLAKVNIGTVNKRAVFLATDDILNDRTDGANWQLYFNK